MLRPNRLGNPQALSLALATLLAAPMAVAQDSGVGVDLHFGNALDPTGVSGNACDPDGASWLTSERKRTPSGQLYLCPPQQPTLQQSASGEWWSGGQLGLGYLYINDENNTNWLRFNDWSNGVIARLDLHFERPADGSYADIRGSRISSDNQFYKVAYGRAGQFRLEAFARSQPNVTSGHARSIWDGVGSNNLTLKPGLTPAGSTVAEVAAVSAASPGQVLKVVRDKFGGGINYTFNRQWSVYLNGSHEQREGARPFGGPFFFAFAMPGNGGVYETPRPIDDSTMNFNGGLRYVGNLWRMDFGYSGSFFRNQHNKFNYEVPFAVFPFVPGATAPALPSGEFAYEPENDYHNLRASATRKFGRNSEFSIATSFSSSRQNDDLLAPMNCQGQFGINLGPFLFECDNWNTTAALSRTSADLRIDSTLLNARLVTRPNDRLTLRGNAKFHRQDYKGTYFGYNPLTGQYGYIAENGAQGSAVPAEMGVWDPVLFPSVLTRIRNLPLDKEIVEAEFGADWRLDAKNNLGATYTFTRTDRTHREVERQEDNLIKLSWTSRAIDDLTLRANYSYLDRKGRDYNYDPYEFTYSTDLPGFIDPGNLPPHTIDALRKYDVGGRKQHKATLIASLAVGGDMTVSGTLRGDWNDYDAELGRQQYDSYGASLSWDWQPSTRTTANAFLGYDRSSLGIANINELAAFGSDHQLGGDSYLEENRWWVDDDQRNYYAGFVYNQQIGKTRLDLGWNYSYSRGLTDYRYNSTGALAYPALAAMADAGFTPMLHKVNTFTVSWAIPIHPRAGLRLFNTYEMGRLADWHYSGLDEGLIVGNRAYLDSGPGNYDVNMTGVMLEVAL